MTPHWADTFGVGGRFIESTCSCGHWFKIVPIACGLSQVAECPDATGAYVYSKDGCTIAMPVIDRSSPDFLECPALYLSAERLGRVVANG
jgi:hypothetical protein